MMFRHTVIVIVMRSGNNTCIRILASLFYFKLDWFLCSAIDNGWQQQSENVIVFAWWHLYVRWIGIEKTQGGSCLFIRLQSSKQYERLDSCSVLFICTISSSSLNRSKWTTNEVDSFSFVWCLSTSTWHFSKAIEKYSFRMNFKLVEVIILKRTKDALS